jgi:hypothetical protein
MSQNYFPSVAVERQLERIYAIDPFLKNLEEWVAWEEFRSLIESVRPSERSPLGGQMPYDAILMFKILVLKTLHNLSDGQLELQIRNQILFQAFLHIDMLAKVPDAKTIWYFQRQLQESRFVRSRIQIDTGLRCDCGVGS